MKKVFQKIVEKDKGDCMSASIASLFEMNLEEVPYFKLFGDKWFSEMWEFYKSKGYDNICCFNPRNLDLELAKEALRYDGGVDGFFEASVKSQTFENAMHSVVIDTEMKIVHDPNPNQLALKLRPEDITEIVVVNKREWYFESDGTLVKKMNR